MEPKGLSNHIVFCSAVFRWSNTCIYNPNFFIHKLHNGFKLDPQPYFHATWTLSTDCEIFDNFNPKKRVWPRWSWNLNCKYKHLTNRAQLSKKQRGRFFGFYFWRLKNYIFFIFSIFGVECIIGEGSIIHLILHHTISGGLSFRWSALKFLYRPSGEEFICFGPNFKLQKPLRSWIFWPFLLMTFLYSVNTTFLVRKTRQICPRRQAIEDVL